ncbi:MAG: capsular polysaccharide synthesis protein [Roseburia sp.]|nr:capsular polysaccharide synthesis protein [Roseburia sp.]
MKFCNCRLDELQDRIKGQKLILFGIGEYWELYVKEALSEEVLRSVSYVIDNHSFNSEVQILNNRVPIYHPSKLLEEDDCFLLLSSGMYIYEMYEQLASMDLCDDIRCYAFPLIMANSVGKSDIQIKEYIKKTRNHPQIEKVIHCFWFSGDKKPEAYQKCIDSWVKICPDYEIREWNVDNYDYTVNKFMQQAIEQRKWAFASDYARLDVIYRQGGIYMDMDVELLHSLDSLLGNEAFFTFDTQNDIDLGTFAAKQGNPLIKKIMALYDDIEFSDDVKTMNKLCQPRYIRSVLKDAGVRLNGNLQLLDGMVFLPRNYLAPLDSVLYEPTAMSDETLAMHHFNAGWRDDAYREKRIANNRKLWKLIEDDDWERTGD